MSSPEVLEKEGKKVVLLGNEAIARGALEAGVGLSACYPGTPSSEVGMTLAAVAKKMGFYFEWSTNEKVAFETCAGASYSGVRTITAMKHFGVNVASDSIFPVVFTGVKGGLVIMVADDPYGHSSAQSEQDSRFFSRMGKLPCIEPANAQEAKDFTKIAFEMSEKYETPVILRTTTLISHAAGTVKLGKIKKPKTRGKFVKDYKRFYSVRPELQKMHDRVNKRIDRIEKEYGKLNKTEGSGSTGIITSGVSYQYIKELGKLPGVKIGKLNLTHPISRDFVSRFLKGLKKVVVVEELEPIVEDFVRGVAKDVNPKVEIYGKNILPRIGEYSPDIILEKLAPILKIKKPDFRKHDDMLKKIKLPVRKPVFCPGCPHRSTFYAVKKVLGKDTVWAGDIGCYVLGIFEPYKMQDFVVSMGSSLGITHGIKKVSDQKAVVFIGDSTFFHAGMAGLVNMKIHGTKPLVIIMDNSITAMTGHQPHPGSTFTGMGDPRIPMKIEDIVKSFGIKNIRIVNAFNQAELQSAIKDFSKIDELSVIIARGLCTLMMKRIVRKKGGKFSTFEIMPGKSHRVSHLVKDFACPAIIKKGKEIYIKEDMCWGCGVCVQLVEKGTIVPRKRMKK